MDTRVTLMLAWFDEPPDMLYKCVASTGVIADRIVVADGAYEQVRDKAPESPREQKEAIERGAAMAEVELCFLQPQVWAGQVAKRNALLAAATEDLRAGDWVMPLDADWVLHGIREEIRHEMTTNRIEQFRVKFRQPNNPNRNVRRDAPHPWHVSYSGKTRLEPLLFRAMKDMKLDKSHWDYSGVRPNGTRIGFSGGARIHKPAATADMKATFLIEHRCMFREDKQLVRNKDFCRVRDAEKKRVGYER